MTERSAALLKQSMFLVAVAALCAAISYFIGEMLAVSMVAGALLALILVRGNSLLTYIGGGLFLALLCILLFTDVLARA